MIKLIGYAISFVAGASIGALISHAVTKNKVTAEALKKIEDMHAYYEEEYGHIDISGEEPEEPEETEEPVKDGAPPEIITTRRSSGPIVKPSNISEYKDYTQYYNAKTDPAESEHPQDDEVDENYSQGEYLTREIRQERSANSSKPPKMIPYDECGADPAYRVVNLTYYTGDDILCESGGEFIYEQDDIDIINDLIGDALDKYGFRDSDEDLICVRNYAYGIDYEIVKVDGYYSDLVGKGV